MLMCNTDSESFDMRHSIIGTIVHVGKGIVKKISDVVQYDTGLVLFVA